MRQHRNDEARVIAERAFDLDPLSQSISNAIANVYFNARQYERAREQFRKTIELDPNSAWGSSAHIGLAKILLKENRPAEALEEFRLSAEINPTQAERSWLAYGLGRAGRTQETRAILRELQTAARQHWVSPVYFARIHLGLGEYDQAIARLRESYAAQSDHLVHLSLEPAYDPLRNHPRFIEILRGVGLPQ
jgi:serine/threonine-protein kinase